MSKYEKKHLNKKNDIHKTPDSSEKSSEDVHNLPKLGKSISLNPNPDWSKLIFMQKAKSFKQTKWNVSESKQYFEKSSQLKINNPQKVTKEQSTTQMHSKDTYTRKQRKPRIPLIDQCSLLMTSERDEKAKGNKTTKPKKLKISKASSPSNNVSKNMKIMNNEVYSSKKFLVEIESRDTFTDFEDAWKQAGILNDSSHSTSKDPDASKENQNFVAIQSTKSSISSKDEPFDKRSKSKIPLKRGITVNFAETSYPIIHDTKNQNYTSYMWHGRSFRKNRITPMISSDNTNINEGIDNL